VKIALLLLLLASNALADIGELHIPYYKAGSNLDCADPIAVARVEYPDKPGGLSQATYIGMRDCDIRHGNGPALEWQSRNLAGNWHAGISMQAGLIDATPGRENGDLDVRILVDGNYGNTISFTGYWAGQPAGILPWPNGLFSLGGPNNWWKEIWLMNVGCPPNIPGTPKQCVRVNGGVIGVY
jgi:hypothetical protein